MNNTSSSRAATVLIVDDHGLMRDGIRLLLRQQEAIEVIGLAATGVQAVLTAQRVKPDVIIMDLVLPTFNGIEATLRILALLPQTKIIILSSCCTVEHVYRALRAGARGYISKDAPGAEFVAAIRSVLSGKQYLSATMSALVGDAGIGEDATHSPLESLSAREREVLHRTVEGYSSAQIGEQMSLSPKTVDTYRSRLMQKLGVSNRSHLIRFAIQHALAPC